MVEGAGLELHRLVWRVEGDERRKRVWGSGGGLGGRRFALGRGRGGVSLLFFSLLFSSISSSSSSDSGQYNGPSPLLTSISAWNETSSWSISRSLLRRVKSVGRVWCRGL